MMARPVGARVSRSPAAARAAQFGCGCADGGVAFPWVSPSPDSAALVAESGGAVDVHSGLGPRWCAGSGAVFFYACVCKGAAAARCAQFGRG